MPSQRVGERSRKGSGAGDPFPHGWDSQEPEPLEPEDLLFNSFPEEELSEPETDFPEPAIDLPEPEESGDPFPFNSEFRYPGDPPHWIRLRQPVPDGARLFAQGIEVAGISFESARENALSFAYGKERSLELKRDPGNPYDGNAVEVWGRWRSEEGKECYGLLGYVPRELALRLAQEAPSAELFATLETLILPRRKKSPGIRFSLWVSS
ncbi:MAG: HIRAN domain-containing protein [Caldiserica bacterium]|nr:HIRAN domain-containing protein [Caldisericota bacterium]